MKPDISIIVPAFGEEERLGSSIRRIVEFVSSKRIDAELIVIDDGSTDRTADTAREAM